MTFLNPFFRHLICRFFFTILFSSVFFSCSSLTPSFKNGHQTWRGQSFTQSELSIEWVVSLVPQRIQVKSLAYPLEYASPIIDDSLVVVGTSLGQLTALDRKTGKHFWQRQLNTPIDSEGLLFKERIYIGNADGLVFCLDKFTGKVIWQSNLFAASTVQPTVNPALQLIYFHLSNNYIVALNSETGTWVWSHRQNSTSKKTIKGNSQPLLAGDFLFVGFSSGELICFRASDGSIVWEKEIAKTSQFSDIDAHKLGTDQQLIIAAYHGELISLNSENQLFNWRKTLMSDLNAMALEGNEIIAATTDGKVQKLSASDGNHLWTFDPSLFYRFNQGVASTLSVLNTHILLAFSQGDLVAISRETGKPSARLKMGGGINSKMAVDRDSDEIYFLSNLGRLYSVKLRKI